MSMEPEVLELIRTLTESQMAAEIVRLRGQVKRLEAENEGLRAGPGRHVPAGEDPFDDDPLTWERVTLAAGA